LSNELAARPERSSFFFTYPVRGFIPPKKVGKEKKREWRADTAAPKKENNKFKKYL
jgi:hypothetical protein